MKYFLSAIALVSMTVSFQPIAAQEYQALKRDANSYHQVAYFKYKNSSKNRAAELAEIFKEADIAAGLDPVIDIWMLSGEWDHVAIFTLDEGPAELGYEVSKNNAKFRDALAKMVGSTEEAEKLLAEFESLIEKSDKDLGYRGF